MTSYRVEEIFEGVIKHDKKKVVSVTVRGYPIYKKGDKILGSELNSFKKYEGKVRGLWIKSDEFDSKEIYEVKSHTAVPVSPDYHEIEKDFNLDGTPKIT
ncbi:MAG: hypothetical protein KKB25_02485 [Nanoarchaeota archaeon]|nr:hypothetical protein [Nanoarchaeota archaeon]